MFYLKVTFVRALALVLIPFTKTEMDVQYLVGDILQPFEKWQRR